MKQIFVVTHGSKFPGADPGMKLEGFKQIRSLRPLLPESFAITCVICGTGQRHQNVAEALDLEPTVWSSIVGNADSLDIVNEKKVVFLANGIFVPLETYPAVEETTASVKERLMTWPDFSVVCSGRPFMLALGVQDAKSATAYRLNVADDGSFTVAALGGEGVPDPCLAK